MWTVSYVQRVVVIYCLYLKLSTFYVNYRGQLFIEADKPSPEEG